MSYARKGSDSDVYVIGTRGKNEPEPHWECLACDISSAVRNGGVKAEVFYWQRDFFYASDPGHMLTHLRLHIAAGQKVPDYAIERLSEENEVWSAERAEYLAALVRKDDEE